MAVEAFRGQVPQPVSATWQALRHALTFGFVSDELVWYPPGPDGAKGSEEFDKSFEFFPRTAGLELKDKIRELVVLPDAAASPGAQVLDSAGRGTAASSTGLAASRAGGGGTGVS